MDSKTFNVRVDKATHTKMKVLAAKMDVGMSALIRKAVEDILERHEQVLEASSAVKRSGVQ